MLSDLSQDLQKQFMECHRFCFFCCLQNCISWHKDRSRCMEKSVAVVIRWICFAAVNWNCGHDAFAGFSLHGRQYWAVKLRRCNQKLHLYTGAQMEGFRSKEFAYNLIRQPAVYLCILNYLSKCVLTWRFLWPFTASEWFQVCQLTMANLLRAL